MVNRLLKPLLKPFQRREQQQSTKRICQGSTTSSSDVTVSSGDSSFSSSPASYGEELLQIAQDKRCTQVVLKNFVAQSDRQDFLCLKQAMATQSKRRTKHWRDIKFVDSLHGNNYRRWQFKKAGLCRLLRQSPNVRVSNDAYETRPTTDACCTVRFDTRLELSGMSPDAMVRVLEEVHKDLDIATLEISGDVLAAGIKPIMTALIALIELKDRSWDGIVVRMAPVADPDNDESRMTKQEELWMGQMTLRKFSLALEEKAIQHNIPVGVHQQQQQQQEQ
ncbi:expressed unknown protein [Seminavis robusta]|uniref:Uncharacterized protein n=1 Tax=Seminavis robusta TaxID=568900 RepID=A0A9N8E693_9STRA|nr:expressed unknown protein [Seminavis robusta]|eukprot:Sro559_g166440.1 n/a (278) ;mRNA; r:28165-28998